jgi:hypothetical protein
MLISSNFNIAKTLDDCFSCLPPYAGWLASTEKANYDSFVTALRQGYVQLQSVNDDTVTQWVSAIVIGGILCITVIIVFYTSCSLYHSLYSLQIYIFPTTHRIQAYNVALTRFQEVWSPQRAKLIAPMADMLNHSAEPNCEITFDDMGNCEVTAMYDIQPGTPLTISYGDPTNPTPVSLF